MPAPNLKTWKYERGAYTSPPLDNKTFGVCKKFIIRANIQAEFNVSNRIIRIPAQGVVGKKNLETMLKLRMIDEMPAPTRSSTEGLTSH